MLTNKQLQTATNRKPKQSIALFANEQLKIQQTFSRSLEKPTQLFINEEFQIAKISTIQLFPNEIISIFFKNTQNKRVYLVFYEIMTYFEYILSIS